MANHATLDFSTLHKAKFDSGDAASLPASPEGVGDVYFATDTEVLYIADSAGTSWIQLSSGGVTDDDLYFMMIGI